VGDGVTLILDNFVSFTDSITLIALEAAGFFNGGFDFVKIGAAECAVTGGVFNYLGTDYKLSYDGALSVEVVPEPATWALMIGGVGALAFLRRRRNA